MLRLDRDQVTSTGRLEAILEEFRSGEASVLMGTQMLAKGHDFPGVTLVVVILADAILKFPDFRAHERALQILLQVSGRAGRREKQGRVLIQTYDTEHPVLGVLQNVMTQDQFLEQESQVRKDLGYPPFGKMALLRVQHSKSGESEKWLESLRTQIEDSFVNIRALGPTPPLIERVQGLYRMDLLLKAKEMKPLHQAVEFSRLAALRDGVSLLVDIDPHTLGSG
jgi:primosomal protein N' (replication factor Y)